MNTWNVFTRSQGTVTHALAILCLVTIVIADPGESSTPADKPKTPTPVVCQIPGTALELKMLPIPGPDGKTAFWMSDAEVSWDHYDVFVYELDEAGNEQVDAVTRPTRPYISADRGWGHAGYPALSVSHRGAKAFCKWVAARTGGQWRLPTRAEWQRACQLSQVRPTNADDHAWHAGNSKRRTHAIRSKKPDSLGLYDLQGNVAEWCQVGEGEDDLVLIGSCFSDPAESVGCEVVKTPVPEWNDTDPQIPKSIWWLSDAPFAGFRVVCESPLPVAGTQKTGDDKRPPGGTP